MGSEKTEKRLVKASQLMILVSGNTRGEQYVRWMKKLNTSRGIEFSISPEPVETTETVEPVEPVETTVEPDVKTELPPLMSFSINTEAVIALIKAWKA